MKPFKLFGYQEEGVKHLTSPLKASYLADKPGLGKTIQSLTAAKALKARTLLVMCPASIVNQWQEHVKEWTSASVIAYDTIAVSAPNSENYATLRSLREEIRGLQVKPRPTDPSWVKLMGDMSKRSITLERVISRKEKAKAARKMLRSNKYDVMILDEAHLLKERGSYRTEYMFHGGYGLVQLAKKVMLLSGTPMLNRPAELYAMLRACYPEALHDCPTFEAYGYKFCDAGWGYNGSTDYSGSSNADELGARLEGFMLMRGTEVLGDRLPPITYVDQFIPIGDSDIIIDDDEHIATKRRLTGEAKVDKLITDIKRVSRKTDKLAIFYYHESVRRALQRAFPHAPLIKGGMTSFQKSQEIQKFVRLDSQQMLIQLGAGGVGLDGIQYVCNNGYLGELDWTPALEEQAVGRIWRLGQKEPVTIYRPVSTEQGTDQRMDKMNKGKSLVISSILKNVTVSKLGIEGYNDMADAQAQELSRIADALEALVALQGGEVATTKAKPAATKPAAASKPVAGKGRAGAKAKALTHEDARAKIKAELNSVPSQTQTKMDAYKAVSAEWGVKNVMDVTEDDLQEYVDAALAAIASSVDAEAGDDDI